MIVNITDLAKVALDDMFKQYDLYNKDAINQNKYIRVYIKEIAWYGPVFNVAQDEPTSKDNVYVIDDKYQVIINKDLVTKFTVVNIYYNSTGSYGNFRITTDLEWKDDYHYSEWGKPW